MSVGEADFSCFCSQIEHESLALLTSSFLFYNKCTNVKHESEQLEQLHWPQKREKLNHCIERKNSCEPGFCIWPQLSPHVKRSSSPSLCLFWIRFRAPNWSTWSTLSFLGTSCVFDICCFFVLSSMVSTSPQQPNSFWRRTSYARSRDPVWFDQGWKEFSHCHRKRLLNLNRTFRNKFLSVAWYFLVFN